MSPTRPLFLICRIDRHDQDLFRGGWSLELAEHKYTMTTLKPTDGVHSTPHVPAISVSTQMLCSFAAISMAVYLVAQARSRPAPLKKHYVVDVNA